MSSLSIYLMNFQFLQPPDAKAVKSRGSWPGPGVARLLGTCTAEMSRSDQHLSITSPTNLTSNMNNSSVITTCTTTATTMITRPPPPPLPAQRPPAPLVPPSIQQKNSPLPTTPVNNNCKGIPFIYFILNIYVTEEIFCSLCG